MGAQKNIMADLDRLIKRAAAVKADVLNKKAEDGDPDDGTKPATTGEQAASNVEESGKDNPAMADAQGVVKGDSVAASTDGAEATSPSGANGPAAGEFPVAKDADNGEEKAGNKIDGNGGDTGSFKEAAESLKKAAAALREVAEKCVSPFGRYLAKKARESDSAGLKKMAAEMDDGDLAGASSDILMQQLQAGDISDEEANQILQEALQEGAITEEDLAAAAQEMGGAGGAAGDAGAVPGADAGVPDAGAGDVGGAAEAGLPPDLGAAGAGAEAPMPPDAGGMPPMPPADAGALPPDLGKLAKVTPDQPDYLAKLAHLYADDISAGFAYAIKLAEEMVASEDEGKPKEESEDEGKEEGKEEKKEESKESPKEEASEAPAEQAQEAAGGTEQPLDASAQGMPGGMPPMDPAASGLPTEGGLPGAEGGMPTDGGLPGAPIDAMGSLAPSSPEEQQALAAVMQELNIDPAMMQQIMAAAPQAGQDKMASAKAKYRAAIFNKLAQML